ncbi:MAG: metallophosphoesterase [Victivallales bacterium]|nr:metallophosphoesterase [Victivallales bacterium]
MKRFVSVLLAVVLVACSCFADAEKTNETSYSVLVFGDVHFDSMEFRNNLDGLKEYQKKELKRNLAKWEPEERAAIPNMLKDAGKISAGMAFGVQLGDISQGDCGSAELQKKAFATVLGKLAFARPEKNTEWQLFAVKGNHDIRGEGAKGAYDAVMLPYLEKQFREKCPVAGRADFALKQGPDLYIFFDSIGAGEEDLRFVETTLAKHGDARHVFFLTHLPVIPASQGGSFWIVFERKTPLRRRLLDLLAARKAIVLAAHIHNTTLTTYRSKAGTITQFTSFSMPVDWKDTVDFKEKDYTAALKTAMDKAKKNHDDEMADFIDSFGECRLFTPGPSYNVMRVTDGQVTIERHASSGNNVQSIRLIEK